MVNEKDDPPQPGDDSRNSESSKPDSIEKGGSLFIERVIEASARNRFLVFIFILFGIAAGLWAIQKTPLDAIPDLSDAQVIVYTDWEGRSPDLIEDQITFPRSSSLRPK